MSLNQRWILLIAALMLLLFFLKAPAQRMGAPRGPMGPHMMGQMPREMTSDTNPITEAKVNLGRMLFYDPRISKGHDVSCNSCHSLKDYGVDGQRVSSGHLGQLGNRNSPSVYNAAAHIAQFWDGRAASVEEQAKGPILNPVEMAMGSEAEVIATLKAIPGYQSAFQDAFPNSPEPVTFDNVALAIGAFERRLVTPSRWDRFMAGDRNAITAAEMAGHHEFMQAGCSNCHNTPFVGGQMFQKLGVEKQWPSDSDLGRMEVSKNPADRLMFKVPSLRNVEKTGPYFHDGTVASLQEAVRMMSLYQLNRKLEARQVEQIVAWLKTLTGDIPTEYIRVPTLPQ
jgi:cytochrome c peroxidase